MRTIAVVGGGFSGTLFALKMAEARPQEHVILIERDRRPARGVAYGACSPDHLLNVPVSRMEVGLSPGFAQWLLAHGFAPVPAANLADAFVPRAPFGDYMEARFRSALAERGNLQLLRGEAVALLDAPATGVRLWDGREVAADVVVLALGNLPPQPLRALGCVAEDGALYAPDPWARDALEGLDTSALALLIGTGLTTVDIALRLAGQGHRGPILAVSRHGLAPQRHQGGGSWRPFLDAVTPGSPVAVMARIRLEARAAVAAGVPWQRVLDAARPGVAAVWQGWSVEERRRFLRHARTHWDTHRHRMAPTIADRWEALMSSGQLRVVAGRIARAERTTSGATVTVRRRGGGGETTFTAARIVNCTGPRTDFDVLGAPLVADIRRRGLLQADSLRLGLESASCALVDDAGRPSRNLFALGPLTRPAWWEVTAVPEITVQVDALVAQLCAGAIAPARPLTEAFNDMGAGI
jgi:uncharacterized NAD(P)/FAD-binding protein YdhS